MMERASSHCEERSDVAIQSCKPVSGLFPPDKVGVYTLQIGKSVDCIVASPLEREGWMGVSVA